jgi:hypothetical protein
VWGVMYTNFDMKLQQRNDIKTLLGWLMVLLQNKTKTKTKQKKPC